MLKAGDKNKNPLTFGFDVRCKLFCLFLIKLGINLFKFVTFKNLNKVTIESFVRPSTFSVERLRLELYQLRTLDSLKFEFVFERPENIESPSTD